ncbi:MAG: hypothetical protein AB3N14_14390 [Flavobacteriaceae bacterium]
MGIAGGSLLLYITQISGTRYFGMFYFLLFTGLWIDHYSPKIRSVRKFPISEQWWKSIKKILIYGILGLHLLSGLWAYGMDLTKPFTNAEQVAQFLNTSGLSDRTIVTKACDGTPLSGYLQRKIYFTSYGNYQSYCIWGNPERNLFPKREVTISSLEMLTGLQEESIIFISFDKFFSAHEDEEWTSLNQNLRYRLLMKYEESIVKKGKYYIYEVEKH